MNNKFLFLFTIGMFKLLPLYAQSFCDSTGNVVIFSNYDGGTLNINVDVNIPNLKIGINGYENDSIILSGTYLGNVTQVMFAGYYNSNNHHCTPWPSVKSINGVSASLTQIIFAPPSSYTNPYGYSSIICNYSCDVNSSQGGCNTADQIADYFFNQFSSTHLLFHYTQYGCWNGTYNLSSGGNCCAVPISTSVINNELRNDFSVSPNPSNGKITVSGQSKLLSNKTNIEVYNSEGRLILTQQLSDTAGSQLDFTTQPKGIYLIKITDESRIFTRKVILE